MARAGISIRAAEPDDRDAMIRVGVRALGWVDDNLYRRYLAWKHDENPFGPSLSWVATADDRVVGFRTFMRWEVERGGEGLKLVRAVDTATDPDYWRQGIFRDLTLTAVEAMTASGLDAVLNLPNSKSGPGYLTMGWSEVGRPSLGVVPRRLSSLVSMAKSRSPAERWSEQARAGRPAIEAIGAMGAIDRMAGPGDPKADRWVTPRTSAYLEWRYSFAPLAYRAVDVRGGICIFRVRRRGPSREVALCDWLSTRSDRDAVRRLVAAEGDYGAGVGLSLREHGAVPLPRQGPLLTWRPLARPGVPSMGDLGLTLGDLELF